MIKNHFALSKLERNGIYALIVLCAIIFIAMKFWQYNNEPETVNMLALQDSVYSFYESPPPMEEEKTKTNYNSPTKKWTTKPAYHKKKKPLVVFEINTANYSDLVQINGISDFFAKEIIKERTRLGGYTCYFQLLNIYNMTEEKIESIKPQLKLDPTKIMPKTNLNTADSLELAEIPAISTYCATNIVKYRERLGGFYSTKQLLEINCIDKEHYSDILLRIKMDTIKLRKLDINNAEFKTIMKHPYIDGYDNTRAIFRYLDFDEINSWEEFIDIPKLNIANPEGLKHYLKYLPKIEKVDSVITTN